MRDSMKQVDILHRGQSVDLEVREPPDVVSLPHHVMQPTIEVILLVSVLARSVGEMLRARHSEVFPWSVYRHDDSLETLGEAGLIEHSANLLRCRLIFAQRLRPPGVEIGNDIVLGREAAHKARQSCCRSGEIGIQSEGGHNDHTLALLIVSGFDEWAPVSRRGFEALQGTNTIVAAGERLEHEEA